MKAVAPRPRRIAWVFPGFGVGGAQVRFAAIANRLGPKAAHSILSLNGDLACQEKLSSDIQASFPAIAHRRGRMLASVVHARSVLRAQNPDLVVTSNWGAIEWAIGAKLAELPHIHTEDGFGPEERNRQIPRRVITRRLVLRGSQVVLPSRLLLRIATDIWRLPPTCLHYIPNGINIERFAGAVPAPLPPGEGPVIGTIAALRPEKNLGRLLRAFALLTAKRPARLVIVGDGPERASLENLAKNLAIAERVTFSGHSGAPETWLAAFDLFALTSDTEQMPLSLLEAMAAGLPTVCTDVGDVRAMLAAENREFVTPTDETALAGAFEKLLSDDLRKIGASNRAKAARDYTEEQMFTAYARLLGV